MAEAARIPDGLVPPLVGIDPQPSKESDQRKTSEGNADEEPAPLSRFMKCSGDAKKNGEHEKARGRIAANEKPEAATCELLIRLFGFPNPSLTIHPILRRLRPVHVPLTQGAPGFARDCAGNCVLNETSESFDC